MTMKDVKFFLPLNLMGKNLNKFKNYFRITFYLDLMRIRAIKG